MGELGTRVLMTIPDVCLVLRKKLASHKEDVSDERLLLRRAASAVRGRTG